MTDQPEGNRGETCKVVLTRLIGIFPAFDAHWRSTNNLARREDGSFTYCGVFMEFGFFFRERYEQLPADCLPELGAFISECAESSNEELCTAVCTCFLENMAGEHVGRALHLHLSGEARRFYEACSE